MAACHEATINEVNGQMQEIFKVYTNLTAILLEFGYEHILENMDKFDDVKCIADALDFLNFFEPAVDEANPRNFRTQVEDDDDYLLRISTGRPKVVSDEAKAVKNKYEVQSLRDQYLVAAAKLTEKLSNSNFKSQDSSEDLFKLGLERSAITPKVREAIAVKAKEKLSKALTAGKSINKSINVENLNLKI